MDRRPIVWILKEQTITRGGNTMVFDYTGVMEYGDIEFATTLDYPPTPSESVTAEWRRQMAEFLKRYDPEHDWIVPTGSPLSIFLAGGLVSHTEKPIRLLIWQQRLQRYYPLVIGV